MTIMETKDICRYFGGLKAVDHVNMEVQQGEIFGIIGPNGAGKTTFFNVCSGVIPPTSGQIFLMERRLLDCDRSRLPGKDWEEPSKIFNCFA